MSPLSELIHLKRNIISMNSASILGIDGGATKVLAQRCIIDPKSLLITPQDYKLESTYSDSPDFDSGFKPIDLSNQKKEARETNYNFSEYEINQSSAIINSIVKTIVSAAKDNQVSHIGLCFPGIKTVNKDGIAIIANGPRSLEMLSLINEKLKLKLNNRLSINKIYDDSECCLIGEWKSTTGKLIGSKNAIYIGGGTGIADGIILDNEIVDINAHREAIRSWEMIMANGESVEQCLSLGGMLKKWNSEKERSINAVLSLFDNAISGDSRANEIIEAAAKAFAFLVEKRTDYFHHNNSLPEKIVIGQRLGDILSNQKNPLTKLIFQKNYYDIPIEISTDRRTAALGAAYKTYDQ